MALYLYRLLLKDQRDSAVLGLVLKPGQPLYIGVTSGDELERPFRHIKAGRSQKGTVRKTIMVLWPELLVSGWFAEHVEVKVEKVDESSLQADGSAGCHRKALEQLEASLIKQYEPPLNLNGWKNPLREKVRAGRRTLRSTKRPS